MRVTYSHGTRCQKSSFHTCRFLSISPSPFSCVTHLCCPRTVMSRPLLTTTSLTVPSTRSLLHIPRPKSAGHAQLRTMHREVWLLGRVRWNAGYEPKQFDIRRWWHDAHQRSRPQFLRLLENSNGNTNQFGVHTVFESSVLLVSHDDFALQIESKESMQWWNRC